MEDKRRPKINFSELEQGRRRQQQGRHLKMELRVSVIICQLFRVIMILKCILSARN